MNFAKYRVQLSTEKKYSSKYEYKYEYEYSIPANLYLLSCVTLFKQLSLYKRYINNNSKVKKKELNSPVTNQLSSHLQLKEPIKLFVGNSTDK